MKKYIFKIVIVVFPFFTAYSQSDTVCNPSFEDSLNSWGLINNGSSISTLSISCPELQDTIKMNKNTSFLITIYHST